MICPNCNAEMENGFLFCGKCGTRLESEPIPDEFPVISEEEYFEEIPEEECVENPNEEAPADVPQEEEPVQTSPPPAKKRGWLPYLILVILFAMGLGLFLATHNYAAVTVDPAQPWFSVYQGALSFDPSLYPGGSELTVPETIGGQTVTKLEDYCFEDCDQLTIVFLPNTIREIGAGAFQDCSALRGIFIPGGTEQIGSRAFADCRALESVCIPYTVESIGSDAFRRCGKLMYIFYSGKAEQWRALYTGPIAPETFIIAADETIQQKDVHD